MLVCLNVKLYNYMLPRQRVLLLCVCVCSLNALPAMGLCAALNLRSFPLEAVGVPETSASEKSGGGRGGECTYIRTYISGG